MRWWIFGLIVVCMAVLALPVLLALVRLNQPLRDAGWKRVGWFTWRTGPYGGPYVESGEFGESGESGEAERR